MNKAIYRAFYSIDGVSYEYVKIVACSRTQAKKILDHWIRVRVGSCYDCSPLPDYLGHAYNWRIGEVHGDLDHDFPNESNEGD